ncbi:MAG: hypothetical protein K8F52_08485 [Candidatus Scalindua rubra]|uniref:Uncharacterized protein n=1 Tax=Candidatus Scalindua brodae TaxID=237368 RepID=A0A0B0EIX5_9BACT|nr:MAG: hypothetical protein SCABRO_02278 [Candidatus Scalindua brodae]MBZ0108695.1 hypothetical protein [Candidatus Scalindua rubra]TWU31838.1 hypothetical protein S225a_19200 [Candidatus Brocadiaceae bacterium S225]
MDNKTPEELDLEKPNKESSEWFAKLLLEESFNGYKTVWDLYLKFYTVFLSVNLIALAAVLEHISQVNRLLIVIAFIAQNAFSLGTAIMIAVFSKKSTARYDVLCRHFAVQYCNHKIIVELSHSPTLSWLGVYGGFANAVSHLALICCWIVGIY